MVQVWHQVVTPYHPMKIKRVTNNGNMIAPDIMLSFRDDSSCVYRLLDHLCRMIHVEAIGIVVILPKQYVKKRELKANIIESKT